MHTKQSLRAEYKAKRAVLISQTNPAILSISFSALTTPLRAILETASCLAAYVPIDNEADPLKLAGKAREMGVKICLPHIQNKISPMQFLEWEQDDILTEGPYGLKQPSLNNRLCTPDVVLAPVVAFDRDMVRLGQGAGHYDRALSQLEDVIVIGVAWSVQEADKLPYDPWDIPLNAVLTEKEWIIS